MTGEVLVPERFETKVEMPDGSIVEHVYEAWPKQALFHRTRKRYVLFGGARGPGKTVALVEHVLAFMLRWPGVPVVVVRKDLKDLKKTFEVEWLKRVPKQFYDPKFGGQRHKGENWYRFFNGSTLYLGEGKDWESYKSMTIGMFVIDEGNETDEELLENTDAALRWTMAGGECERKECAELGAEYRRAHPRHPFYQIVVASNPAPGWLKQRFWEPWKMGRERENHAFIPATAYDNPSLPPDFIPNLLKSHTQTWVQNFIQGDWSSFENMVWPRFSRALHVWRGPLPAFKRVTGGIDWGGTTSDSHRTAAYLTGETASGVLVTFWGHSSRGQPGKEFFAILAAKTREHRVQRWDADASQARANEALRLRGIPVHDAARHKGSVKDGINIVDRELTPDATGRPRLYVGEGCEWLLSGIETYQLDPESGEPERGQEDDDVNAWRYNVMCATRERGVMRETISTEVVNAAGSVTKEKQSGMMARIKEQRRQRLKEQLERLG